MAFKNTRKLLDFLSLAVNNQEKYSSIKIRVILNFLKK